MSGRHLRRRRRSILAAILAVVGVLVLGAVLGAGGSVVLEDRDGDVGTDEGAGTAQLTPDPGPITIALVGDVTAGGTLGGRMAGPPEGFVGPLADVLQEADLTVANVDAPVVEDPAAGDVPAAAASILEALAAGGVDVVSLANDRSLDRGTEGLYQALGADEGLDVLVGLGVDEGQAYRPFVREVGGHTVAVIAATQVLAAERIAADTAGPRQPGVASAKRVDRLVAEVEAARAAADTVVVYVHWGAPGETCPSTSQQELATALVAAGADVVAGPGSGRLQGAARSGDAVVAYGLGDFLVDEPDDVESGVLLVEVDGREVLGLEWVPARRVEGVPQPLEGQDATAAVADWESRRGCAGLAP